MEMDMRGRPGRKVLSGKQKSVLLEILRGNRRNKDIAEALDRKRQGVNETLRTLLKRGYISKDNSRYSVELGNEQCEEIQGRVDEVGEDLKKLSLELEELKFIIGEGKKKVKK